MASQKSDSERVERNFQLMRGGRASDEALHQIADALDSMVADTDRRAEQAMASSQGLSPNLAVQLTVERAMIARLRKKLLQKTRVGRAASSRLGKDMTVDKDE